MSLRKIVRTVLSYCEIPEEIAENCPDLYESPYNSYIEHTVTPIHKQNNYDSSVQDYFDLDNWIIDNYPELEGETILIHIDY